METKKKGKLELIVVIVGILLYLGLFALNGRMAGGGPGGPPADAAPKGSGMSGMNGVIGQIMLVDSITMVLLGKKKGFIVASVLNLFNACFVLFTQVIKGGNSGAVPGVVVSAISIGICFIIYFYVANTKKMTDELTESYQKAIEQTRLLQDKDETLRFLAYYDKLTGMPNRELFVDNINDRIKETRMTSLVYIDIDNFRNVNDTFGHNLGDDLLVRYAERITQLCGDKIFAAKIGGDEFGILLDENYSAEDVMRFVGNVANVFSEPVNIRGDVFSTTASVGVSIFPTDTRSAEDLFRCAETAMFSAKANGKNQLCFYRR